MRCWECDRRLGADEQRIAFAWNRAIGLSNLTGSNRRKAGPRFGHGRLPAVSPPQSLIGG